ncbi:FHA domain-containing protein [Nocardia sp. NPDC059240]|uniref:FHA domain-containing protein n=1 Tax=Nocardia sp. NPDC059240 TaxID=3346786 RepID=UPI003680A454
MGRIPTTVGLVPGAGLVARFGNVVLFLHGESGSTDRILGAAEAAASAADPGVAIAQRLAATVFSAGSQPPPFGVVAPTADGILILLRGAVTASVDGPEGARTLSGERAMTWADEIVRDPVRRLTVIADGAGSAVAHTDLRAGVVVGGGFVLNAPVSGLATARPAETPPQADAKAAEAGRLSPASAAESANPRNAATTPAPGSRLDGEQRPRVPDSRVRIEVQADGPETRATPAVNEVPPEQAHGPRAAGPDLAKKGGAASGSGAAGSNTPARRAGRPDPEDQPPTAAYSPEADAPEEPRARGAGPALPIAAAQPATPPPTTSTLAAVGGALTGTGGEVYPLDRPYVIGRDPMIDEAVRRAVASPIVIARDRHVSRVHARVFIENGLVYVRDAGTPGGTFVAAPGAADWVRVGQRPTELPIGWSLRIGERILTYRLN